MFRRMKHILKFDLQRLTKVTYAWLIDSWDLDKDTLHKSDQGNEVLLQQFGRIKGQNAWISGYVHSRRTSNRRASKSLAMKVKQVDGIWFCLNVTDNRERDVSGWNLQALYSASSGTTKTMLPWRSKLASHIRFNEWMSSKIHLWGCRYALSSVSIAHYC